MPTPTNCPDKSQLVEEHNSKEAKEIEDDGSSESDGHNLTGNTTSKCNTTGEHKRHRPRKKKLYVEICKQLEFYFSDANITKNRMMYDAVTSTEFVSLKILLEFNKMQKMTSKVEDLQKALAKSDKLVLSEDKMSVKRKDPYDESKLKDDATIEECTIYVENVPRHVDHEWLETIFQVFGPITYISLPKFRHNGQPKGFAFVEFESVESSSRCLEAYGQQGACLPGDLDPAHLQSIQTYEDNASPRSQISDSSDTQPSPMHGSTGVPANKKRKFELENEEEGIKEKKAKVDEESKTQENEVIPLSKSSTTESTKKKKKRKQNKAKKTTEEKLESDSIKLKVLPKKKWRQLRSRYLNLQRENMSKLKRQLKQGRYQETCSNRYAPESKFPHKHFPGTEETPTVNFENKPKPKSKMVKISLSTPSESVDIFRKQIFVDLAGQGEFEGGSGGLNFVKYVDYEEGKLEAFVRLDADPSAEVHVMEFVHKAGRVFKSVELMSEKEGDDYWTSVRNSFKKQKKNKPKKGGRGRDKLLLAASKSNHVHFDDDAVDTA